MRSDCWFEICVGISPLNSLELIERAPMEPLTASTRLPDEMNGRLVQLTHLHFGAPPQPEASPGAALERLVDVLNRHAAAFARFRRFTPFHLAAECHYESEFDVTFDAVALALLARLRMAIDVDLFWKNDQQFIDNETDETPFPYGRALVLVDDEPIGSTVDARRELGRHVAGLVQKTSVTNRTVTFDVRGGCGRPVTHFSANAVRHLARYRASMRLRVRPEAVSAEHAGNPLPRSNRVAPQNGLAD